MKIFFDTNVIIDYFTNRDNSNYSVKLVEAVVCGGIKGVLCTKQFTDIYYCLRRYEVNSEIRIEALKILYNYFEVLPTLNSDIKNSLYNCDQTDFEDFLLEEISKVNCMDYFVTNNVKDFRNSKNVIFTPKDLCLLLNL